MASLRKKMEGWMRDESIGPGTHLVLHGLSLFYGAAVRLRLLLYASGLLRKKRLPCAVVSVGNITAGGTGKTPLSIYLADYFRDAGKKAVVLSRGYGGSARGTAVVSDGQNILLSPAEAGDEPYLMAERLAGVPVVVSPDRVRGGRIAIERFSPDVIILDDGFQHIRLERDVNILLVDSVEGFGNGFLLPRGILREHVSGVKRADVAMVKGGNLRKGDREVLKRYGIDVLSFRYNPTAVVDVRTGAPLALDALKGKKALAVAGVANPNPFFRSLERLGAVDLKTLAYADHHAYTSSDFEAISAAALGRDIVITTEKDAVKLKTLAPERFPLYALRIDVEVKNASGLAGLFSGFMKTPRTQWPEGRKKG